MNPIDLEERPMRLFGTILPFIGFREYVLDDELRQFLDLPPEIESINAFQIEWFGLGATFFYNVDKVRIPHG